MDKARIALIELLGKMAVHGENDFLRESVSLVAHALMDLEVSQQVGAEKHAHNFQRRSRLNGTRERKWKTRAGSIDLQIPKLRKGTYYPSLLTPHKRSEEALISVVADAYVQGVSTRKMEQLALNMGITRLSKSEVSRMCAPLDEQVQRFRNRPLEGPYPYVWLDATYLKVRQEGKVVSQALIVAIAVNQQGQREMLGWDLGPSEDTVFWSDFLRSLVERGLTGVQLVISDAHSGLKQALSSILSGSTWQRCKVHFLRNLLARIPKSKQKEALRLLHSVWAAPTPELMKEQWHKVTEAIQSLSPKAAALMDEAEVDVLAFTAFPLEHWRSINSNNLIERLNREIKRRSRVVSIFPSANSVHRLIGQILILFHEDWMGSRNYLSLKK